MSCAPQYAAGIPGKRALQEVVARFTIRERVDVRQDQAFLGVGDVGVVIERMYGLLEVLVLHLPSSAARWVNRLVGRQAHAGRIL